MITLLRSKIDKIDEKILKLIAERFETVSRIGRIKHENGLKIKNKSRETAIFAKIKKLSKKFGLSHDFVSRLYEMIIDESRKLQG